MWMDSEASIHNTKNNLYNCKMLSSSSSRENPASKQHSEWNEWTQSKHNDNNKDNKEKLVSSKILLWDNTSSK